MVQQILNVMGELAYLAITAIGTLFSILSTNRANKNVMHEQQNWQESMVDKQNEYNTPANQVDRLNSAGINPIAGTMSNGMSVSGNTSASPNSVNSPNMLDPMSAIMSSILNLGTAFNQGAQGKTANSLRELQRQQIQAETAQYMANVQKLGVDTKGQIIANEYADALNQLAVDNALATKEMTYQQIAESKSLIKKMTYELENVLPQQVKESVSRTSLNVWDQKKVIAEIERIDFEKENIQADTSLKDAQATTEGLKQSNIAVDTEQKMTQTESVEQQIQMYLDCWDDLVSQIASEAKISKKQARWFVVNQVMTLGKGSANASTAVATGALIKGAAKASAAAPVAVAGF